MGWVFHLKLPLGRYCSTGACRKYTVACHTTVGHLASAELVWIAWTFPRRMSNPHTQQEARIVLGKGSETLYRSIRNSESGAPPWVATDGQRNGPAEVQSDFLGPISGLTGGGLSFFSTQNATFVQNVAVCDENAAPKQAKQGSTCANVTFCYGLSRTNAW